MKLFRPLVPLLIFFLAACSDSGGNGSSGLAVSHPQLELTHAEAPIALPGIAATFSANVRYGDAERDLLDIFLPESDAPTPLVLYFHGGGYYQGDKSDAYRLSADDIRQFLQAGIAFATINYPFLNIEPPYDDEGVINPLIHSARALQFLRYYADSLNIDPQQVASYGFSAGASTSLWLGTHDDLADPDSPDPVLRESTRLRAVGALHTQGTLNILRWEDILAPVVEPLAPVLGGTDILTVATFLGAGPLLYSATGADSVEEIQSPEQLPYMQNIDAIGNMDAGDAPLYALNDNTDSDGDLLDLFLHHTLHVIALHDRAQAVGLENVMYARDPVYSLADPSGEDHISFLTRHIR